MVFEWDSKECKENYAKEQTSCITYIKALDNPAFHFSTPTGLPTSYTNLILRCDPANVSVQPFFYLDPKPPDKIFLRHLALLI